MGRGVIRGFDQDYPVTIITQKMACVMISGIRVRLTTAQSSVENRELMSRLLHH